MHQLPPIALASADALHHAKVQDPAGILAILLGVLAVIFYLAHHPVTGRIFKVIPSLVFCYFVPTLLTTLGVLPDKSPLYAWVKSYVLPASLLLLILALDVKGIIRLGPKAGIMLLAGTAGVVIGGPISLLVCETFLPAGSLPDDIWQGMAALCGSWIGGGANFVALGQQAGASSSMMALMVIPDVLVANIWMGVLLYLSGHQRRVDKWTGADASAIRELEQRMTEFQERTNRIPAMRDLMMILAVGFGISYLCYVFAGKIPEISTASGGTLISHTTWKYVLVTTVGIALSFTAARNLEGAGASKVGSVMIYLLVACIGAGANFHEIRENWPVLFLGIIWIMVHITVLLVTGYFIKAPIFFVAVGSQANIGGAASAPIVASAFHPSLAPVGVLLAVAGYVLGTYAGWICMQMLRAVGT